MFESRCGFIAFFTVGLIEVGVVVLGIYLIREFYT